MSNKVLIIGSGGREHALGWSIAQDPDVAEVIYAPGNAGTGSEAKSRNVNLDITAGKTKEDKQKNFTAFADLVEALSIDSIVVGPEQPLVDGVVDFFNQRGYNRIFGPSSAAAAIEADKFFSYDIMETARVPQAQGVKCYSLQEAVASLEKISTETGVVIKARGLTGGKGVSVFDSEQEALANVESFMAAYQGPILVAERLFGQEFSVFGISDGERVVPLEMSVQDHKRLLDFDKGPNTGGMGAYGPVPFANSDMVRYVAEKMMTPVVQDMKQRGIEYKGFLYAGVMMTKDGPKILEFNCRFGDPEAQPSVMMLEDGLYKPISAALEGKLDQVDFRFKSGAACCVVMAANGYPDSGLVKQLKGLPIGGLDQIARWGPDYKVFHAGTSANDGKVLTNGGRVLGVTAYSESDIAEAQSLAYDAVNTIDLATRELNNRVVFIYRADIAAKAMDNPETLVI